MNVQGFSHVTIRVSNLERSLDFYCGFLGMTLKHKGRTDAYLEWGNAWVCLLERPVAEADREARSRQPGVDHVAFHIREEDFPEAAEKIRRSDTVVVRGPVRRGKGWSINFLDPDGTELELHTSNLQERLEVWK